MTTFKFYLGLFPHHNPVCTIDAGREKITLVYSFPDGRTVTKNRKIRRGKFRLNFRYFKAPTENGEYTFYGLLWAGR